MHEEDKTSMGHHFLEFQNDEVTKSIGLFYGNPDMKPFPPLNKQILGFKRPASIRISSILHLSHSLLFSLASNWTGDKSFQIIKLNKKLVAYRFY